MLAELDALHRTGSLIRIPPADGVPVTDRVRRIIDTAAMRRLASISQLGMVSLVYPGAAHNRLEHSLGVYLNALRVLSRFDGDPAVQSLVDGVQAESFLLAALVHDIGHWPFCHPIEDMQLPELDDHESRVADWLKTPEVAAAIDEDWQCSAEDVLRLLDPNGHPTPPRQSEAVEFLASCLSGPIDVDKLDYLQRDSLHAGVPYGRHFDADRLVASMCMHPDQPRLAIGEKGRTAAEMMVFARYVMFSEVYWHHAVRSATAMLQRSVFLLRNRFDLTSSLRLVDAEWVAMLRRMAEGSVAEPMTEGLFGPRRRLYKRVAEFTVLDGGGVHAALSRRPYWWLVACAEQLAQQLSKQTGIAVHAADVLIDAPPVKLEVDINVDVIGRDGSIRALGQVSPVASSLAHQQFDDQVKRVRVFVRDDLREPLTASLPSPHQWSEALLATVDNTESNMV